MKKYIIVLLFFLGINGFCFSQNIWVDPNCNNYTNNGSTQTFYDPTLLLSPCNTYTTNIGGTANVQFLSDKEVNLQPGFVASSFSGGMFEAMIIPSTQSTINYYSAFLIPSSVDPSTNLPTIEKYQKMELGVSLPLWIKSNIDNFLNGSRVNGITLNPYAQDSILVEAIFLGPDSKSYVRYGFYYESVSYASLYENPMDSMDCLSPLYNGITSNAYISSRDNPWPFRIRFAPPLAGSWSVDINIYLPYLYGNTSQASFSGNFNVTDNSNGGYIVKGNNWHLKYVNGGSYFPIGQNIWPSNSSGPSPYPCCSNDWGVGDPPSFVQCRADIKDVANNNGNYVRLRAGDSWGYLIDWDDKNDFRQAPGNYENRQYAAWELDKTVGLAENTNVKLQPVLFEDQNFSPYFQGTPPYVATFSWDKGGNTYYNLLHSLYPTENWDELLYNFFSDPTALYYVERYLFYMNARWGYSPSISTWELWNEADELGLYYNGNSYHIYSDGSGSITAADFQTQLTAWQINIMNYLRNLTRNPSMPTFYPVHLVTCGYAGTPAYYDNAWLKYDIFERHDYVGTNPPENTSRVYDAQDYATANLNPFLFGELGALSNYDGCQDISFHDAYWATGVVSSGAGLYWDDWQETGGINHRANFNSLNTFFSQIDFEGNIFFQFPIYYWDANDYLEYYYLVDNAADLDATDDYHLGKNTTPETDGISTEIGWVHNLTTSYENNSYSANCAGSCTGISAYSESASALNLSSGNVEFYGLNPWTDYNIKFFDPYASCFCAVYNNQTASWLGNITLRLAFGTYAGDTHAPDYGYYISESGGHKSIASSHVLPNDTVYVPMDSLAFPGTSRNYHKGIFNWDFGNGEISHSSYPKFIYYTIGDYLVTVDYSDTVSKVKEHVEQTYIVLKHPFTPEIYNNIFTIEPNPGTGIFTIIAKNSVLIDELDITDATGKLCLKEISPKENTFNISPLASGIYFVKILSNGLIYNQKVVKY